MERQRLEKPFKEDYKLQQLKQLKSIGNTGKVTDMKNNNQLNGSTPSNGLFLQPR